ncbi:acetamidase/formamidase family protein, partial [Staphylococcus warneri]|uniref:acetamidase/formamidase family protein n=1 Tax=Staphylococcus warneri TaxID=1292 RepID=UPI0016425E11
PDKELVHTHPNPQPVLPNLPHTDPLLPPTLTPKHFHTLPTQPPPTLPPPQNPPNSHIKNLSKPSPIYFPLFLQPPKLSVPHLHFSQRHPQITFSP